MTQSASPDPAWGQVVPVHRVDRWSIYRRLKELNIPCACPTDGTLRVEVNHPIALVLVQSAVRQFTAPRGVTVDWLERCWDSQVVCTANH